MHLRGLLSTQEARVALASYPSFVLTKLPRASITRWLHAARLPLLNCEKYQLKKTNYSRYRKLEPSRGNRTKIELSGARNKKTGNKEKANGWERNESIMHTSFKGSKRYIDSGASAREARAAERHG